MCENNFFWKISSAIALRPLCAHGSGLGPEPGTGRGAGVWVCVGVSVCVCVPVPPPLTEEQPDHRPRAPPPARAALSWLPGGTRTPRGAGPRHPPRFIHSWSIRPRPCPLPLRPRPALKAAQKRAPEADPLFQLAQDITGPATLCTTEADDGSYIPCQSVGRAIAKLLADLPLDVNVAPLA
jgi:hypothetical protein